jgi:hypothetical protein
MAPYMLEVSRVTWIFHRGGEGFLTKFSSNKKYLKSYTRRGLPAGRFLL